MSIFVNNDTRLVVQGITGRDGVFHAEQMATYGTKLVAGVTPGKGGLTAVGVPVFNTVAEAVEKEGANTTCIFVPPAMASDAIEARSMLYTQLQYRPHENLELFLSYGPENYGDWGELVNDKDFESGGRMRDEYKLTLKTWF